MADVRRHDQAPSPQVATVPILICVAGGLLFLAATMVAFAFTFADYGPSHALAPPQAFPDPQLRPDDSSVELDRLMAEQQKRLKSYGWANADHTLVQIPIARATDIIAGRGPAAYGPIVAASPAGAPPAASEAKP